MNKNTERIITITGVAAVISAPVAYLNIGAGICFFVSMLFLGADVTRDRSNVEIS